MNINKLDKMESLLKKCKVDLYKNFTEEAMYKNFTWKEGSKIHYELAVKFLEIFIFFIVQSYFFFRYIFSENCLF